MYLLKQILKVLFSELQSDFFFILGLHSIQSIRLLKICKLQEQMLISMFIFLFLIEEENYVKAIDLIQKDWWESNLVNVSQTSNEEQKEQKFDQKCRRKICPFCQYIDFLRVTTLTFTLKVTRWGREKLNIGKMDFSLTNNL